MNPIKQIIALLFLSMAFSCTKESEPVFEPVFDNNGCKLLEFRANAGEYDFKDTKNFNIYTFEYDAKGRIIKEVADLNIFFTKNTYTYEYNANTLIIKQTGDKTTTSKFLLNEMGYVAKAYDENGKATIIYTYDKEGHLIKSQNVDATGKLTPYEDLVWENGNLRTYTIQVEDKRFNSGVDVWKYTFSYWEPMIGIVSNNTTNLDFRTDAPYHLGLYGKSTKQSPKYRSFESYNNTDIKSQGVVIYLTEGFNLINWGTSNILNRKDYIKTKCP